MFNHVGPNRTQDFSTFGNIAANHSLQSISFFNVNQVKIAFCPIVDALEELIVETISSSVKSLSADR
eukprot:9185290-Ditylum_brightwellii.AAC.1